jgi:alkanesulfonate monooxygenase SsuD/methylene tetrahydromethanopterin reductase-like flavin-dependent oxidoreductase (luciferase family)
VCVWALAADTHEEAMHHALGRERWRVDRARGLVGPLQAPDAIAARGFTADEWPTVEAMRGKAFVGTGAAVGAQLRALARELQLDEIVINTWAHDPAARRDSYALIARECALAPCS